MPDIPDISGRLEYKFSTYTSDIIDGILQRLGKEFPELPLEKLVEMAKTAVDSLPEHGNMALQQGLILYGTEIAKYQRKISA